MLVLEHLEVSRALRDVVPEERSALVRLRLLVGSKVVTGFQFNIVIFVSLIVMRSFQVRIGAIIKSNTFFFWLLGRVHTFDVQLKLLASK